MYETNFNFYLMNLMMIFMNNNEKNMAQPNKNHYFRQCKKKMTNR